MVLSLPSFRGGTGLHKEQLSLTSQCHLSSLPHFWRAFLLWRRCYPHRLSPIELDPNLRICWTSLLFVGMCWKPSAGSTSDIVRGMWSSPGGEHCSRTPDGIRQLCQWSPVQRHCRLKARDDLMRRISWGRWKELQREDGIVSLKAKEFFSFCSPSKRA